MNPKAVLRPSRRSASALKNVKGPVVLVGHFHGGSVISDADADNPEVKALVYFGGSP
ncbi:hypothetical protein [Streptomyces sp. NPDC005423]|uniref:hypothetical protein n=1 Tax=Streptomyces sp. NPDC005423 TaxID=3155343 RepID=UPI0033AA3990